MAHFWVLTERLSGCHLGCFKVTSQIAFHFCRLPLKGFFFKKKVPIEVVLVNSSLNSI